MLLRKCRHPLSTGMASCNRGWPCTASMDLVRWLAWAKRVEIFPLLATPFMSFESWSESEVKMNLNQIPLQLVKKFQPILGDTGNWPWNLELLRVPTLTSFAPQVILLTSGKDLEALLNPLGAHRDHASKVVWQQSNDSRKVKGKAGVLFLNRNDLTESKWVSVSLQVDLMKVLPNVAHVLQWTSQKENVLSLFFYFSDINWDVDVSIFHSGLLPVSSQVWKTVLWEFFCPEPGTPVGTQRTWIILQIHHEHHRWSVLATALHFLSYKIWIAVPLCFRERCQDNDYETPDSVWKHTCREMKPAEIHRLTEINGDNLNPENCFLLNYTIVNLLLHMPPQQKNT